MFGTSGIRGIYGRDITEDLARSIASIFAGGKLSIGRDIRHSGRSLLQAAAEGALSAGSDVVDLGIAPTPTIALATRDGSRAIAVTASHNPPEYNGLKLIERGKEIGKGLEENITKAYHSGQSRASSERGTLFSHSLIDEHKGLAAGMVDGDLIARRRPRVIVDCNGAACVITPYLLSDLGCEVISVNSSQHCFNRPSEPNAANLSYLSAFIRDTGADFAIAHDGDGDRCIVLDDKGDALPFDAQLAMMIDHELAAGKGKIVSTVEASLTIRDAVEKAGSEVEITPVGSTHVAEAMEKSGALFGGEPCGEYIYKDGVHVPDAVAAAAKFAEIFCSEGPFSKLKTRYPQHFMVRERFPVKDKEGAIERIKGMVDIEGEMRSDDGIRVDEKDGWFLIRASGTEPIVRLTLEYVKKEKLEERETKLKKMIKSALIS